MLMNGDVGNPGVARCVRVKQLVLCIVDIAEALQPKVLGYRLQLIGGSLDPLPTWPDEQPGFLSTSRPDSEDHHGFLSSKLENKASLNAGAMHCDNLSYAAVNQSVETRWLIMIIIIKINPVRSFI